MGPSLPLCPRRWEVRGVGSIEWVLEICIFFRLYCCVIVVLGEPPDLSAVLSSGPTKVDECGIGALGADLGFELRRDSD